MYHVAGARGDEAMQIVVCIGFEQVCTNRVYLVVWCYCGGREESCSFEGAFLFDYL